MCMNVKEYLILYYKHGVLTTCFGHTGSHPQGGALQWIYHKKHFEPLHKYKILGFKTNVFKI